SEIVESSYFMPMATQSGEDLYEFRPTAMHFALGLELVDSVQRKLREHSGETNAAEILARIVEPVHAFDRTADILTSALAVACLKGAEAREVTEALIAEIVELQ